MTAAAPVMATTTLDTRPREDQLSPDRSAAKQREAAAAAKSASPPARGRGGGAPAAPAAAGRPRPPTTKAAAPAPPCQPDHHSLLERLAAAAGLSTFVGALYVSTTLLFSGLALVLSSAFANPVGWLLLALWLALAVAPLGTGPASRWGFGLQCEAHAALTSPAPEFGRRFVRYVTAAAGWYFPVRVVVEGEDEEDEGEQENEQARGDSGGAAAATPKTAHARRHAATLHPDGAYMIGLEPHSVLPLAMPACFSTDSELCPRALRGGKIHGLASSVCFSVPLIRHLWWFLGIRPVTRRVIARLLCGGDAAGAAATGRGKAAEGGGGDKGKGKGKDGGGLRRRRRPAGEAGGDDDDEAAATSTATNAAAAAPLVLDRRSVVLVPGGVQECLYMQQPETGVETAFLSNRRGFVRLALRCGADGLVPVFAFGQSHGLSWARPGPPVFSEAFVARVSRSLGALPLALWGRWGTPAPHRKPMVVVVGRPLPLPRPDEWQAEAADNGDPPAGLVQAHLEGYIRAMEALVERHRVSAGFPETTLRVL